MTSRACVEENGDSYNGGEPVAHRARGDKFRSRIAPQLKLMTTIVKIIS